MKNLSNYENYPMPRIGETVYLVYKNEIFKEKVYAIGEGFFIPTEYKKMREPLVEVRFSDYYDKWFLEFDKAKDKVLDLLTDEWDIIQGEENWWYASKI